MQDSIVSTLDEIFQPLYLSKKRYFFLTGGRGSTKTYSVHDFVAKLTYEKGHGILFTRYTMKSAEKSIIPEFTMTLERLGMTDDFHITKTTATNLKTGSFIFFSGIKTSQGDQTANLKSLPNITTWIRLRNGINRLL
jgi:phage terminase large subunit